MQTIKIIDYKFSGFGPNAWAYVEIFGEPVNIEYSKYDAITAAIELGLMEEPTDRDRTRVGYEKTAFSATVREVWPWEQRVQYVDNDTYLCEFEGTDFAEQIVSRLALQAPEVREVIQAEAERIALHECPAEKVEELQLKVWWSANFQIPLNCIDWKQISDHKKQLWYAAEQETISQL